VSTNVPTQLAKSDNLMRS